MSGDQKSSIQLYITYEIPDYWSERKQYTTRTECKHSIIKNINLKQFFDATDNLKSLTMIFRTLWIADQVLTSFYNEEVIPHVTNMLKRNEDMKFLKVIFFPTSLSKDTYKEDWISMIHEFWETVLLHPSLCYVSILESSIMIDILNDMKKTLITQRKEKKLGPHPIVEMTDTLSLEEMAI